MIIIILKRGNSFINKGTLSILYSIHRKQLHISFGVNEALKVNCMMKITFSHKEQGGDSDKQMWLKRHHFMLSRVSNKHLKRLTVSD